MQKFYLFIVILLIFITPISVWCQTSESNTNQGTPSYLIRDDYYLDGEKLLIRVHIWGEIRNPGSYMVPDNTNIVELISLAGGPTEYADISKVRITHKNQSTNEKRIIKIDVNNYLKRNSAKSLSPLKPGDIVYVPYNTKRTWREIINIIADIAIIANVIYLISMSRD